jgi:hypothetical protein
MTPAEKQKAWRAKNPERAKTIADKHRLKNKTALNLKAKLRAREKRASDPEASRKALRDWYAANPYKRKAQQLWRYYRMPIEEYERLYKHQNGRCSICSTPKKILCVDHNHTTGEIRGLLCHHCNQILHRAKDNEEFFKRVVAYISKPPARTIKIVGVGERNPQR